jgi:hypothetical protein
MRISPNLMRWALAGLTAACSIVPAQAQFAIPKPFNPLFPGPQSSKSLAELKADVAKATNHVNASTSVVQIARNAMLAHGGFAQLNPLYQEALKLNITPEKFDINVIAQRRDIVQSVYNAMMEQGKRPGQQYFPAWWAGSGSNSPSVLHRANYIAFLAHSRVREAYLTGRSSSEITAVNAVFADVSTWEDKLQNEALLLLPWPGRTVIQGDGKFQFTNALAIYGDGQYRWRAWGANPGKGTIERHCDSGDGGFKSDPASGVRKMCMVISGAEITTGGTLCARGATCNLPDQRYIYAAFNNGEYGLVGAGPFKCGTGGDCRVLPLAPFDYGYQTFVSTWTRVIE